MANPVFKFEGDIRTNVKGNQVLCDFYKFCSQYRSCTITLDWSRLFFMDANLSALLMAIIHKAKQDFRLKFFLDYEILKGPMSIFWRNGLANCIYNNGRKPEDDRLSTIKLKAFKKNSADGFADYIQTDLLKHRGVEAVSFQDREKVKNSYFEIFNNYEIHSGNEMPVLACGQFFPKEKELKFTLVDMGVGFLNNISKFTLGKENISTPSEAMV